MLRCSSLYGLVACVFAFSGLTPASAFADDRVEYAVKAGNIGNIVGFVTWPGGKIASKETKIEICVLGDNPILNISNIIQKKYPTISLVKEARISNVSSHCQALFIGTTESEEYDDAVNALKGKPVLTISDAPDFIERGGMVMLLSQGGKVRFVINKGAMERATLHPDTLLLESAVKVIDD